jgi:hypothetical protein
MNTKILVEKTRHQPETKMKVTPQDFRAAKKAAKTTFTDVSLAHRRAMEVLRERCPQAGPELIQDMAMEAVRAARN